MTHRLLIPLLLPVVLLGSAPSGKAPEGKSVTLEGQVFANDGTPVPGVPVRVLLTRRLVTLKNLSLRDEFVEGPSTSTDHAGFFRIDFRPDPDYDFYYVRFYDRTGFDAVRYALTTDEDITTQVRAGRSILVQRRLGDAPNWPAVVGELQRVGGVQSPRGKIIRAMGLPDEVVRLPDGTTEWRYEAAGVRYLIEDGQVVERAALGTGSVAP